MSVALNTNKNEKKPLRRLSNFRIKEVSLVDEAANEKKFLVVKSKEASQKDKKIFKEEAPKKPEATNKGVSPMTYAQLVMATSDLCGEANMFHQMVKDLGVEDEGQYSMGPDLTGKCVGMLEKMSQLLFMFGSDSTLGFDSPVAMVKHYLKDSAEAEVQKVGRAMSSARLSRYKESMNALETGLAEMKKLLQELETHKKEEKTVTEAEKKAKEAELKKKLDAEEAKLRKELGLEEAANAAGEGNAAAAAATDQSGEVATLKAKIADLEKALAAKTDQTDLAKEVAELKKSLKALEDAGGTAAAAVEETEVNKGKKKDEPEYIEKNGRKVRKGLFSGLAGAKLGDVLAAQAARKY